MAKNKNRKQASRPERGADGPRSHEKSSGEARSEMAPVSPADVARKQRRFGHN